MALEFTISYLQDSLSGRSTEKALRSNGGPHTPVLGFLENGDTAQIGGGEPDIAGAVIRQRLAFFRSQKSYCGPHHGVAHPHDVDARHAGADVRVRAGEIVQDRFLP